MRSTPHRHTQRGPRRFGRNHAAKPGRREMNADARGGTCWRVPCSRSFAVELFGIKFIGASSETAAKVGLTIARESNRQLDDGSHGSGTEVNLRLVRPRTRLV